MFGLKENENYRINMTRRESVITLRPEIPSIQNTKDISSTEKFQNEVLRPILKYQHDLLVQYIITKAQERNEKFLNLIPIEKERYLDKVILKDSKIKHELNGFIIGLMTLEEFENYLSNESELKRRISTMVRQRIISTF